MAVLAFVIVMFPRNVQPRKFLWSKVEKSCSKVGGIDSKLQNLIRPYIIFEDRQNFSLALFMLCALTISSNLKNSSTRFLSSLIGSEFSYSPVFGEITKMQCNKLQSSPIPYFHFSDAQTVAPEVRQMPCSGDRRKHTHSAHKVR